MKYGHLAAKLFNRPIMANPVYLQQVGHVLLARMRGHHIDVQMQTEPTKRREHDGVVIQGNRALIEVYGTITRRPMGIEAESGPSMSHIDTLIPAFERLGNNSDIDTIDMMIDSNGGESNGVFEAARVIRDVARQKQVNAWLSDYAFSAGYLLAAAANDVYVPPEGEAGSVGVWILHLNIAKALEQEGIEPTLIQAGEHKTDGHPFGPLPDSVHNDLQAEVDELHTEFINAVAGYRGIDADAVRATEARIYRGQHAIDIGFADAIATPRFPAQTQETTTVSFPQPNNAGSGNDSGADQQAALDAAHEGGRLAGIDEGTTLGVAQERERWVTALADVKPYQLATAVSALRASDMSAENIGDLLKTIPDPGEQPQHAQQSSFDRMMSSQNNPDLNMSQSDDHEDEQAAGVARMLSYHRANRRAAQ